MQKSTPNNSNMLLSTEEELFNKIVDVNHPFRKLNAVVAFDDIIDPLRDLYSDLGQSGIDIAKGFKALLVQFWENYSDRQMEKAVKENIAIRWFCGFSLTEDAPDHTYFCKLRTRLGTQRIAYIFNGINEQLRQQGLFGNVFHFIDASAIVSKTALWEERDKAILDGEKTLNNAVVSKYAADKDAKWGAKSKRNIWFGYKRSNAVDMRFGLIEKTIVTPANVLDFKVLDAVCPNQGMVFTDKLYDCREADAVVRNHRCHNANIRKNNNQAKQKDLDRWRSSIRMPFEGTFSKLSKRARFRGLDKVSFQNLMQCLVHNLKKAVTILPMQIAP